jgi:hypothetical protein
MTKIHGMRYFFVLGFLFFIQQAFTQQPFQGTIVYNLKATGEKKEAELTAMFGVNKIKLKFKDKEVYDKEYVIIDFDSGKLFNLNTEQKNYKTTVISTVENEMAKPKLIAGYNTTPVQSTASGPFGMLGQLIGGASTFYVANDLIFPLDPKYSANSNLIIINNNKIVLGATIKVRSPFSDGFDEMDTSNKVVITAEAIKIDKTPVPIQEFIIPADYVAKKKSEFSMDDAVAPFDSTDAVKDEPMEMDSVAAPVKKPTAKPKSKPTAPKKPVNKKGEATQTKKS